MQSEKEIEDFILNGHKQYLNNLSVDCVIFGFHDQQLKVLLVRITGRKDWVLPGGHVNIKETVDQAAIRVLQQRTGIDNIFLQQFQVFSEPDRSRIDWLYKVLKKYYPVVKKDNWLLQRFVSVGYYALVEYTKVTPLLDMMSDASEWWGLDELPPMLMDHRTIVNEALQALQAGLNSKPIGYNLLPRKFTMPELQSLYETILGKKLDRSNFSRKMLAYEILKTNGDTRKGAARKAPFLYSFDLIKYRKALKEGLNTGW
ncbi:NUDIX hydrolase [Chitinophaga tropicalis]|uniref:NUDIX domain-containing protein n=1 Tax=Chitinophaga tropicalis TaxID=2683588 RepID=A0A7K1U0K7_9BACT|nr:NUDIX domain-containing protein [Chitinophaga tropicalis]MVT07901.1 NUDIX domain-containing protein [Chitinophaga tropicalis]